MVFHEKSCSTEDPRVAGFTTGFDNTLFDKTFDKQFRIKEDSSVRRKHLDRQGVSARRLDPEPHHRIHRGVERSSAIGNKNNRLRQHRAYITTRMGVDEHSAS